MYATAYLFFIESFTPELALSLSNGQERFDTVRVPHQQKKMFRGICADQTWLRHIFNMSINQLFVTETRLQKLEQSLDKILGCPQKVMVR